MGTRTSRGRPWDEGTRGRPKWTSRGRPKWNQTRPRPIWTTMDVPVGLQGDVVGTSFLQKEVPVTSLGRPRDVLKKSLGRL